MGLLVPLITTVISGLYTSLWGAFKDSPYEGFKARTFPRSLYFNVFILLAIYSIPYFGDHFRQLGLVQIFFLIMGIERFLAELYKGFFRTEDQQKYLVPSRITFFGRFVASDLLRRGVGLVLVLLVFWLLLLQVRITHFWVFALVAYLTGLLVALGGAYKDAPFEGFKILKFQRSALVLLACSPLFYFLNDPEAPVALGFLIYMNGGLERFVVEYYKTYIQRNMSGKFRPDLERDKRELQHREKFHYGALIIIAALVWLCVHEIRSL